VSEDKVDQLRKMEWVFTLQISEPGKRSFPLSFEGMRGVLSHLIVIYSGYTLYLSDLWKWFNYSQEKAMYIDENKHVWHFHLFEKSKCNTMMNKKDMMNLCQILADLEKQNKVETISYLIAYMIKRFTLSPRR